MLSSIGNSALAGSQLKGFTPAGYQFFAHIAHRKENEELSAQLVAAAQEGNTGAVNELLAAGADPDFIDPGSYGRSALTAACNAGNIAVVQLLLDAGAKINHPDKYAVYTDHDLSQTPLIAACACDKKSHAQVAALVELLLERGADVAAAQPKGRDGALHFAARNGHEEVVRMLLARKAKPNAKGTNNYTPLMRAVEGHSLAIAKMLIDHGADILATVGYGHTAFDLMLTDKQANVEIARLLIDLGADFKNYEAEYGPLGRAAAYCNKEIVGLMIERGAKIATKDREGRTPMDEAIRCKNHEVIKHLLAHGADPKSQDRSGFGKTLLQYATISGDAELVRDVCKALVASGSPVDDRDAWGKETALMTAAGQGHGEIAEYLIAMGADVHARDARGNTALAYAASGGHVSAMKILLAHGADIHGKNNLGWNTLMQAAYKGQLAAAETLINAGSSVNEIDLEHGYSTLRLAGGNAKLVELLRNHGAHDRIIRERKPQEPYFLITDCDLCTYLPHYQVDLGHDYSPEDFPGLETIYDDHSSDYKAETTNMIKKCRHCGTYYHQYHFIDTEDPIGGIGADVDQNFRRASLFGMQVSLHKLGKKEELAELEARYPVIVKSFIGLCETATKFMPYILPYVAETLADYFTLHEDGVSLKTYLLENPDPAMRSEVMKHLKLFSEVKLDSDEPADAYWELKQKARKMLSHIDSP